MAAVISRLKDDKRTFFIGTVGIRRDDKVVSAYNGNQRYPDPKHHAEFRLSRKLTPGSVVYVSRTRCDGTWALAKPCKDCHVRLVNFGIERVYYTIGEKEYGVLWLR